MKTLKNFKNFTANEQYLSSNIVDGLVNVRISGDEPLKEQLMDHIRYIIQRFDDEDIHLFIDNEEVDRMLEDYPKWIEYSGNVTIDVDGNGEIQKIIDNKITDLIKMHYFDNCNIIHNYIKDPNSAISNAEFLRRYKNKKL